tara:strand:+ start:1524 stop:1757 length:234 start_codon:yes stop_codon:yes gene_type:complete
MSREKKQIHTGEASLVPFAGLTDPEFQKFSPGSAPKRTLRQLIENELVGVPLRDQKNTLKRLLLLLLRGSANHQNKI